MGTANGTAAASKEDRANEVQDPAPELPKEEPFWLQEVKAAPEPSLEECIVVDLNEPSVDVSAPLDNRDIDLVQQTWKQVSRLGFEAVGRVVFMNIFKIAPTALGLFPFRDDGPRLWAPGGRASRHAMNVVKTLDAAVGLLKDLETLAPILKSLGLRHVGYGVLPEHYDVVGEAIVTSLGLALGKSFTPAVKNAWLKVYTIVKKTCIADSQETMAEVKAATAKPRKSKEAAAKGRASKDTAAKEVAAKDADGKDAATKEATKPRAEGKSRAKRPSGDSKKPGANAQSGTAEGGKAKGAESAMASKSARMEAWKAMDAKAQAALGKRILNAAYNGDAVEVERALSDNCDPDFMDISSPNAAGEAALHYAVAQNKKDCVGILLQYGATVSIKVKMGEWGFTPLHYAARQGIADMVELVFDPKSMNAENYVKKSPKDLAKKEGHDDIVSLIRKLEKAGRT
mmetsp:Transcript_1068/g.2907  ORF Transcript_1068/g.2907 Transcript_1068/m.2907 type:complete len:457 (+) Transcript_1068:1-1371(+)